MGRTIAVVAAAVVVLTLRLGRVLERLDEKQQERQQGRSSNGHAGTAKELEARITGETVRTREQS